MSASSDKGESPEVGRMNYVVDKSGYPIWAIEITTQDVFKETVFDATVFKVIGWDDNKSPSVSELYLKCSIKWDSCSHFWFGEESAETDGKPDGYLHICGVDSYIEHIELLSYLYELAFKEMGRRPLEGDEWPGVTI